MDPTSKNIQLVKTMEATPKKNPPESSLGIPSGHWVSLQVLDSKRYGQTWPPPVPGFICNLLRVCNPPSQVFEQTPHAVHSVTEQSSERKYQ